MQRVVVKPQATVWVCVPKASSHQFHPFTISSVLDSHDPSKPTIAKLAIKPYGKWAKVSIMIALLLNAEPMLRKHTACPCSNRRALQLCHVRYPSAELSWQVMRNCVSLGNHTQQSASKGLCRTVLLHEYMHASVTARADGSAWCRR